MAIPLTGVVLGIIQLTYAWCLNSRCWRWLQRRRRVRATVSEIVETDRDGREFRRSNEEER